MPCKLRLALEELSESRGEYVRERWRYHGYGLAIDHEVEIHVPCYG